MIRPVVPLDETALGGPHHGSTNAARRFAISGWFLASTALETSGAHADQWHPRPSRSRALEILKIDGAV